MNTVPIKQDPESPVRPEGLVSSNMNGAPDGVPAAKTVSFDHQDEAAPLEPMQVDAPMDQGVLHDFASIWEVAVDIHSNYHANNHHHQEVHVLRPDPIGLSPPRLDGPIDTPPRLPNEEMFSPVDAEGALPAIFDVYGV